MIRQLRISIPRVHLIRPLCTNSMLLNQQPIKHYFDILGEVATCNILDMVIIIIMRVNANNYDLGVKQNSAPDEIKRAYFDQSKLNHPDLHPGDKGIA